MNDWFKGMLGLAIFWALVFIIFHLLGVQGDSSDETCSSYTRAGVCESR